MAFERLHDLWLRCKYHATCEGREMKLEFAACGMACVHIAYTGIPVLSTDRHEAVACA